MTTSPWPPLPFDEWQETCEALHHFAQVLGKVRLANSPWLNHSWHATLYPTARGLTTGLFGAPGRRLQLDLDLREHELVIAMAGGEARRRPLVGETVAAFHGGVVGMLDELGLPSRFDGAPNELEQAVPFAADRRPRAWDRPAVEQFHGALLTIDGVFQRFRTRFHGKCSPVHLFWGALDLAVTRFSGREAPEHPGGIPNLPDPVTREAYSHEVSSAGFWPGAGLGHAAFYSYAYPTPEGFSEAEVEPAAATWNDELGEFLLPYDAVRESDDPEATLLAFLQSTYEAAADLAGWDRAALEREEGPPVGIEVGGRREG